MKSRKIKKILSLIFFFAFILVHSISTADTTEKDKEEIRVSIEKSSLPQEKKIMLIKHSNEAVNIGIPSSDVLAIVRRGLSRGWDSEAIEESVSLAIRAKKQNLPVRPVLDRIEQGLSKGIPFERVSKATNGLIEKLSTADKIVDNIIRGGLKAGKGSERSEAVSTVAMALERSVSNEVITKTGMKLGRGNYSISRFEAAIGTMTVFVEMGMPVEHSSRLINKALDKGYSETDMMMMEREMSKAIKEGRKVEDAMRMMESMIDMGYPGQWHRGMGGQMHPGTGGTGGQMYTPFMGPHHGSGSGMMGHH